MLSKQELRDLAAFGMRRKLLALETQLNGWHKEFPALFISATPPKLVKAEPREVGVVTRSEAQRQNMSKAWTPARRRKQAAHARRMQQKMQQGKRLKTGKTNGALFPKNDRTMSGLSLAALAGASEPLHAAEIYALIKEKVETTSKDPKGVVGVTLAKLRKQGYATVKDGAYSVTAKGTKVIEASV